MVITSGMFPGGSKRNQSTRIDQVEIDGQHFLRYTHRDGRMEYRPLDDDEVKHLEAMAKIKEAVQQYNGPVAP